MTPSNSKKGTIKNILMVAGGIFIAGIIIAAVSGSGKTEPTDTNKETTQKTESAAATPVAATEEKKEDTQKEEIIAKLKAKAKRDWPEDYSTQEFWVNEQITDYEYMKTIADTDPLKKKAQKDWPLDFSTQKFWYNEQIEAKERMQ